MTRIRKRYVDGPFGQVHARLSPPVAGTMPLVCLHATAYSSRTFVPLMHQAADVRQVIAIDLPGYGESDAPAAQVEIAAYADAVAVAIRALADGGPVALLGYHTGVYVGAELAVRHPALVDRLVLIGIPYFQALDLAFWRKKLGHRTVLGDRLAQFDERWNFLVASRAPEVSLERGFENFVDELKAWPNGWWAHDAMFAYDSDARLPMLRQPVLVLNPGGHLAEPSRVAARLMPGAQVLEMPDVTGPILDAAPHRIMSAVQGFVGSAYKAA